MSEADPVRVAVEIELPADGSSISGTSRDEQGNTTPFHGWLGLISVVEQARQAATHGG